MWPAAVLLAERTAVLLRSRPAPHLDEQLAGAQDEACVCVADAGGELAKGAGVAGVGVCAEQHLAGLAVALLG